MTGENLEDHPALATYTFAASPRFNARIALGKFAPRGVEPFAFRPDLLVPGTFHNSGNRPAPPSEYIPLARRSVFLKHGRALLVTEVFLTTMTASERGR